MAKKTELVFGDIRMKAISRGAWDKRHKGHKVVERGVVNPGDPFDVPFSVLQCEACGEVYIMEEPFRPKISLVAAARKVMRKILKEFTLAKINVESVYEEGSTYRSLAGLYRGPMIGKKMTLVFFRKIR